MKQIKRKSRSPENPKLVESIPDTDELSDFDDASEEANNWENAE
jgi:hypothetical protein